MEYIESPIMGDSIAEDRKVSSESAKARKFALTYYGTTKEFPCGKTQDVVLKYIKRTKGGRGGSFDMVLKDGRRKAFLGKTFEKKENIIGYEFVPEEVASTQPQGK